METTEYLLKLSREIEENAEQARNLLDKIADLPIRIPKAGSVLTELMATGYTQHEAWKTATALVNQRNRILRAINELRSEAEVMSSIADDAIGVSGRLV